MNMETISDYFKDLFCLKACVYIDQAIGHCPKGLCSKIYESIGEAINPV